MPWWEATENTTNPGRRVRLDPGIPAPPETGASPAASRGAGLSLALVTGRTFFTPGAADFSRRVLDVFADRELGAQLRKCERRWRRGEIADLRNAIEELIEERYGGEG